MRLHVINDAFPGSHQERPRNAGTLSPDTGHTSWSPLHSPSGKGRGQGELSR